MLLRHFIGERLLSYYAQSADAVVGGLEQPLRLASLWGQWHWIRVHRRLYRENRGQWLTPVELFQPFYSQIIGNYIVECCDNNHGNISSKQRSIDIIEFGGGRGTNARHVMQWIHQIRPDLYDKISYHIIDASPSLHRFQQKTLKDTAHARKYSFVCHDLLHFAETNVERQQRANFLPPSDNLTIVVALEVLDNLPHDKIRIRGSKVEQAIVRRNPSSNFVEEVFVPLDDALLKKVLDISPEYQREKPFTWVPTVICGVLHRLRRTRPNLHVLLADFDWLPSPDTDSRPASQRAYGEPLVTDMNGVDQACYLTGQSSLCDILFPTNFEKLAAFVQASSQGRVVTMAQKQADFLQTYGPSQVAATKSWLTGFTPLLGDFGNCSILTTHVP